MHMMGDLASVHWDGEAISGIFKTAFPLVTQTIAMAWAATLSSAVIAFWLAPLATSTLITGSYLTNSYARRGGGFVAAHALLHTTRAILQVTRAIPEIMLALLFVMWVGPGPLAGILAIAVHNIGVMGRLYTDVYEEIETGPPRALQSAGTSSLGVWLFGVLPQAYPRMAAFTLYRFEVNVRTTVMVGFVGAGGIGDALNTAISLFHMTDLLVLLLIMIAMVTVIDAFGDHVRKHILGGSPTSRRWTAVFKRFRRSTTAPN
jgi:phosphonate transport system permease protein